MTAFIVRFNGHACAAVKTGLAREPILFRARKGEEIYVQKSPWIGEGLPAELEKMGERIARIACARLIKRTEFIKQILRRDLSLEDLKATKSGRRILMERTAPRPGKRWKICRVAAPVNNFIQ